MANLKRKYNELSEKEIEQLCIKYDEGVKVKDLIALFSLDLNPSELSKHLPLKQTNDKCIYCNIPMEVRRIRSSYSYGNEPKCPKCNHIKYTGWSYKKCKCDNCLLEEYKKLKVIRDEIERAFPKPDSQIAEKDINLLDISKLLFIMYIMGNKTDNTVVSYNELSYCVDQDIIELFVNSLIEKKLMYIDVQKSPIDMFDLKSLPPKYIFEEVFFRINVDFSEETLFRLNNNDYSIKSYPKDNKLEVLKYFMMISLVVNLENLMDERGIHDITVDLDKIRKLLNKVTYNNIRYIQYKQSEYALHLKHVDHVPDYKIAKNIGSMVYNCCNKYLAEGWSFYPLSLEYVDDFIHIFVEHILDEDINILNENINQIFA